MPNRTYAIEWYELAYRNLETARVLIRERHFTDSIALEIHQALEKSFKAIFAYHGISIPRTHALPLLFSFVHEKTGLSKEITEDLIIISDYYESERYPGPRYFIPDREEVEKYYDFAEEILNTIFNYLNGKK
jgi:HEPN domain-containing protein